MPPAAAVGIGVGLTAATLSAATVATITTIALQLGLALAMSAFKMLLTPKSSGASASPIDTGTEVSLREPAAPRQLIYGRTRVGGRVTFVHTSESNKYLHLVITLAGHEVEEIEEVWFDDEVVPFDVPGSLTPGLGEPTPGSRYGAPLTPEGALDGEPFALLRKKLGAAGEAAFADPIAESGGKWTEAHRQDGCASIYLRLKWDRDKYPQGMPGIRCTVKGKKVYDPRSLTTVWSDNAALCLADYLADATFGPGVDFASEIDADYLTDAANICDEAVAIAAGGTEARYTCNGAFLSDAKPIDVLPRLLGAMFGRLNYSGGQWLIRAGAYVSPDITLDEDDLRDAMTVQSLLSRRENFNAVKGRYIAEDNAWQPTDFPVLTSATYEAEDGGFRVYEDIDLPFTSSAATAQRLARMHLRAARQPLTVRYPCSLRGYSLLVGDTVAIDNTRMGWSAKVFDVVDMEVAFGDESGRIGINLTLRETASSIYDWATSDEATVDPAPNSDLPNVFSPAAPSNFAVTEEIYVTRDGGGVKARALLTWAASIDAFVTSGGWYEAAYQLDGATNWVVLPRTTGNNAEVDDIAPGIYDFRLTAYNVMGVASTAITIPRQIAGLSAAPAEPQNMTLSAIGGLALLEWDPVTEIDVKVGGIVAVRHSPAMTGATWGTATSIGKAVAATQHGCVLPLKPGTYLAKTRDAAGIWSDTFASAVTQQSGLFAFTELASVSEDPDWTGGKTNVVAISSALQLVGTGLFDDVADVDAIDNVDYLENTVETSGSYTFANTIDLGAVTRVRLTGLLDALVFSALDMIDDWPDIDARAAIDGDVTGNEADARLWMRKTDTDPAGAPTWTAWQRLDSAEHEARAFEFRLDLESVASPYNIAVSEATVVVEEVV